MFIYQSKILKNILNLLSLYIEQASQFSMQSNEYFKPSVGIYCSGENKIPFKMLLLIGKALVIQELTWRRRRDKDVFMLLMSEAYCVPQTTGDFTFQALLLYKAMADIKMGSSGGLTKYIRGILEKTCHCRSH